MMKKIKSYDEIPKEFESLEAEAEFYDTHDFSELIKKADLKPLKFKKPIKRKYFRPKSEHTHKTG